MPTRFPLGPRTGQVNHLYPNKAGGPTINRGKGNNSAATPAVFIDAVIQKFGPLSLDLAATDANRKAAYFVSERSFSDGLGALSPDSKWAEVLATSHVLSGKPENRLAWLNPPFTNTTPWARKCAEEVQLGARILLLVPASVGANWYWQWVVPYADVYSVGRVVFDDCYDKDGKLITTPYPKDLILCHYEWKGELKTGSTWLQNGALRPRTDDGQVGLVHRWRWQDA